MADGKISPDPNLASPASGDLIPIVDIDVADADKNKTITWSQITGAATEVNDLSVAVTWANIPIANVPTGTTSVTVALGDHNHSGVYLESFTETNDLSAAVTWANIPIANVPTGITVSTVSLGNHNHSGVYLESFTETNNLSVAVTWANIPIANVPTGTTVSTVALGNHNHSGVYLESFTETNNLSVAVTWANIPIANVPTGTTSSTVSLGNHLHTGTYEPAFSKNSAFNDNYGTGTGTVCEGDDSRLSDARTPTSHSHATTDITGLDATAAEIDAVADLSAVALTVGWVYKATGASAAAWGILSTSELNNNSGWNSNAGTVTNVTVGTGLDVVNGTTTPSITLDLSEFTDMTAAVVGTSDELILLDSGAERRKLISEITLSDFSNDSGWTSNAGTVTSVAGGTGLTSTGGSTPSLSVDAAQTVVSSMYNASMKVGNSSTAHMAYGTTTVDFKFASTTEFRMTNAGAFHAEGNITAYSTLISSDRKLKENITPITEPLGKLDKLEGSVYNMKKDGKLKAGLIAQDVQEVMPYLVDEVDNLKDDGSHLVLDYNGIIGLLVEAVKELKKEIEELKGK